MNSPAAPSSRLTGNSFAARALLLSCLLVFNAGALSAQEESQALKGTPVTRAASPRATGVITGRVVSEDGRPLADAVISLYRPYARAPGSPLTATSDGEGKFRVSGVEPGLYVANAMLPGFVSQQEVPTDLNEVRYFRPGDFVNLTFVKGGVITGTVRDVNGEAVVAAAVRVARVRGAAGRAAFGSRGLFPERMTDDRGVYRIYGLPPGTYVVSVGGSQRFLGINAYEGDAPTYFPSSTRDTAAEVPLRAGEEVTGIDIRYRGERGHTVSGTIAGVVEANMQYGISILLRQTTSSGYEAVTFVSQGMKHGFSFSGLADGEYELAAQQWGGEKETVASIPRRVTVKGADVTGVELALIPLASISGRALFEAARGEKCAEQRATTAFETVINARRDEKRQAGDSSASRLPFFSMSGSVLTEQGEFTIRNLLPGSYRLTARLPDDAYYIRFISTPGATSKPAETKSALTSIIMLRAGESITNVTVSIAQDGATLRGRVPGTAQGEKVSSSLPANLKIHLVPTERERADDTLRYAEADVEDDGTFAFINIAPGRYWLITRPVSENESLEQPTRPLAWDAETRAKLRREAEASNTALELKPCQRIADYTLRSMPPAVKP